MNSSTVNASMGVNATLTNDDTGSDLLIPLQIVSAVTLAIAAGAFVLNILVFRALGKATDDKLKVRFLLRNSVVGDMMLTLMLTFRVILRLSGADKSNKSIASLCANVLYDYVGYFASFYQILASLAVALDRFYSIVKPLGYHTMAYGKVKKVIIVGTITLASICVPLPVLVFKINPGEDIVMICIRAFDNYDESTQGTLPFLLIFLVLAIMFLYFAIFGIITWHRRQSRGILREQDDKTDRKQQSSLAVTFFLIHLTYILMYLPGVLYFSMLSESLESETVLDALLGQLVILIYLGNPTVDPLIYIFRIRSVRERMPSLRCCCSPRDIPKSYTNSTSINTDPNGSVDNNPQSQFQQVD